MGYPYNWLSDKYYSSCTVQERSCTNSRVNTFTFLGCKISQEEEKVITSKISTFYIRRILGILMSILKSKFRPKTISIESTRVYFPDWVDNEYTLTRINTRSDATQRVMAAELTRVTHKIVTRLHLVAENCTIFSSRARRPVRKLLDTPSYFSYSITFTWLWNLDIEIKGCKYTTAEMKLMIHTAGYNLWNHRRYECNLDPLKLDPIEKKSVQRIKKW